MNYRIIRSDDFLSHHGILGQKWGVRRYQNEDGSLTPSGKKRYSIKTKNGEELTLVEKPTPSIVKALSLVSPKIRENANRTHDYNGLVNGKKVTSFDTYDQGNGVLNVMWGDTKKSERGKGYMTATVKLGEQIAKDLGFTKMTAELVDDSPDIHTVVIDKQGWTKTGERIATDDVLDVWGGLTLVEKHL